MRSILLVCLLSISQLVLSQKNLTTTALNRFHISRNDTLQEFFARRPVKKDKVIDSKKYYWYNGDSILITKGGISGRVLDGLYTEYFPNKNLREKGEFVGGLKSGTWRYWNDEGELLATEKWKKGQKIERKQKTKKKKTELLKKKGKTAKHKKK